MKYQLFFMLPITRGSEFFKNAFNYKKVWYWMSDTWLIYIIPICLAANIKLRYVIDLVPFSFNYSLAGLNEGLFAKFSLWFPPPKLSYFPISRPFGKQTGKKFPFFIGWATSYLFWTNYLINNRMKIVLFDNFLIWDLIWKQDSQFDMVLKGETEGIYIISH